MLQSRLLADTVRLMPSQHILVLNSAADPFVALAAESIMHRASMPGTILLAEDNVAALNSALRTIHPIDTRDSVIRHVPFHEYTLHEPVANMDIALLNMLYQPSNAWILHGLHTAAYALKPGGRLYVVGAKERGILTITKRVQALFGNVETLAISKGQRVISAIKTNRDAVEHGLSDAGIFAQGEIDEGTRLLLDALVVRADDEALDIGCGAGHIGLHIARLACEGSVTMVDVSLLAVSTAQSAIEASGLHNIRALPSDGAQAVLQQRFDLVVTNPPFHAGGVQTTTIAERFMREAAQVLRPRGRFYLVANRFLKYEPTLRSCFKQVEEVGGNTRFKVLRMMQPH